MFAIPISRIQLVRFVAGVVLTGLLATATFGQDPKKTPPPKQGKPPVIRPGKKDSKKNKKDKKKNKKNKKNGEVRGFMKGPLW